MNRHARAARGTRRTREERAAWWATLAPDALEDEIRANRRAERGVLVVGLVAAAVTATGLVLLRMVGAG